MNSVQNNVTDSIDQDLFLSKLPIMNFFFCFFPLIIIVEMVFKHVLCLAESIIIT